MLTIDDEITMTKLRINRIKEDLEVLDANDENNRFKIPNKQSQIAFLERKIEELEKRKNQKREIIQQPFIGDDRYKKFPNKTLLDHFRIPYYQLFKKDPSISYITEDIAMFNDDSLRVYADKYLIRGEFPFKLMISEADKTIMPNINTSIGVNFKKEYLSRSDANLYLSLMADFIRKCTSQDINLILESATSKECTIAFISDIDFYNVTKKEYYQFFHDLCDNLARNIIYIGSTLKNGATEEEIESVETEYVQIQQQQIAKHRGITEQELKKANEETKQKILKYTNKRIIHHE